MPLSSCLSLPEQRTLTRSILEDRSLLEEKRGDGDDQFVERTSQPISIMTINKPAHTREC